MKTWKETLLHIEDLNEQRLPRTYEEMKAELGKQAEPSYKAGMREVVEWLEKNNIFDECTRQIGVWWQSWQAFLKEKDISEHESKIMSNKEAR